MDDAYKEVGIFYCRTHLGTRNEDATDEACDWKQRTAGKAEGECVFVPLVYKKPPPPPRRSNALRMEALLHAMFNTPSEADIEAMQKALAYYDHQVEMGAVTSGFNHAAARNVIAYALGMLGEYKPTEEVPRG